MWHLPATFASFSFSPKAYNFFVVVVRSIAARVVVYAPRAICFTQAKAKVYFNRFYSMLFMEWKLLLLLTSSKSLTFLLSSRIPLARSHLPRVFNSQIMLN